MQQQRFSARAPSTHTRTQHFGFNHTMTLGALHVCARTAL